MGNNMGRIDNCLGTQLGFSVTYRDAIEIADNEMFCSPYDPIIRYWYMPAAGPSALALWQQLVDVAGDDEVYHLNSFGKSIGIRPRSSTDTTIVVRSLARLLDFIPGIHTELGVIELPDSVRFPSNAQLKKWEPINLARHSMWVKHSWEGNG